MKLPPIQLIALDLDGTTLQSNHKISRRTRAAVQHLSARGVHISICTGRPIHHTETFAQILDINEHAILANGALTYNFTSKQVLHCDILAADLASAIITRMQVHYPKVSGSIERTDGWFWDTQRYEAQRPSRQPTGISDTIHDFVNDNVIKLLFKDFTGMHNVVEMAESLADLPVYVTWSNSNLLEVMAQGVNKGRALQAWAQRLGVAQAHTMAFGDQDNDKEMLQWAGVGVAMGNAPAEIQALANYVSSSNDEEGVALVLEQLIAQHYA